MKTLGDKIFPYSKRDLERNVDQFIRSIPSLPETPPLIPEAILDKLPEVKKLEVMPLLGSKYGVEGMVLAPRFMHRDLTVVIDQEVLNRRDPSRYNMTIAEEIGHIQLHRAVMLDIQEYEDFVDLQAHPNWLVAERDAKYWGRALLMPRVMLEKEAQRIYRRVSMEMGFGDTFQFLAVCTAHLASVFEIPPDDAQRRVDTYIGDLRGRLERSLAARNESLLGVDDTISVVDWHSPVTHF